MLLLAPPDSRGPTSAAFIQGVYIPSALILAGCAALKAQWLPYAAALAVALAAYKVYDMKAVATLDKSKFQEYKLKERIDVAPNTAVYRFALPSKNHILGLPIGQHVSVQAMVNGEKVMRSYTPISSDGNRGYFDLLIKSYPTGRISKHVAGLKLGDTLSVRGPKGAMVYTPNLVKRFGMIAGGTGITPMLQIIRAIISNRPRNGGNDTTEVDLIFANVNPDDILLKEDLDKLAREDEGFRVHYVLNNPPSGWTGGVGFVTPDMIKAKLPAPSKDMKLLLCGPPPMIDAMKKATESLGYDKVGKPTSKLPDQVFCF